MMLSSRKKAERDEGTTNSMLSWLQGKPETICSADQCTVRTPVQSIVPPSSGGYTATILDHDRRVIHHEGLKLGDILSAEYLEAMWQAAEFGFLYTFLTATPNDLFNRHFMKNNFTTNQIFYAKQCINAITMLALSSYLGLTDMKSLLVSIGTPATSAGLKYYGFRESAAQLIPPSVLVATQFTIDIQHSGKTLLTLLSGLGGGLLGQQAAKGSYRIMNDLFSYVANTIDGALSYCKVPSFMKR